MFRGSRHLRTFEENVMVRMESDSKDRCVPCRNTTVSALTVISSMNNTLKSPSVDLQKTEEEFRVRFVLPAVL